MNKPDPIESLNLIERWIVEHGSAVVQKCHIELLRDQLSILKDQLINSATEISRLTADLFDSENELSALRIRFVDLEAENKNLREQIHEDKKIKTPIPEPTYKVLEFCFDLPGDFGAKDIQSHFGFSINVARSHLDTMRKAWLISQTLNVFGAQESRYVLSPQGRALVMKGRS